jgi:hypothetical protein
MVFSSLASSAFAADNDIFLIRSIISATDQAAWPSIGFVRSYFKLWNGDATLIRTSILILGLFMAAFAVADDTTEEFVPNGVPDPQNQLSQIDVSVVSLERAERLIEEFQSHTEIPFRYPVDGGIWEAQMSKNFENNERNWKLSVLSMFFTFVLLPMFLWWAGEYQTLLSAMNSGIVMISLSILGLVVLFVVAGFSLQRFSEVIDRHGSKTLWIGLSIFVLLYLVFLWCYNSLDFQYFLRS